MTIAAGTRLGRYEIRSQIGAGGMGEVYLAHDSSELERTVALKILPAEHATDQRRMQRFIQEAKTVSALNHPNILTIHEIGQAEGTRFIITEYIDGVTLREHMRSKRVKLHEVLDIAMQVAAALDAAHEAKVVHRDIKPENVMVRRRDHIVKVLDFGLAKLTENSEGAQFLQEVDTEAGTKALMLTEPGMVIGTVAYMSPEQSQGFQHVDHRTDIWSLGVVLYEMVAGRVLFDGKDVHRQIIAIQENDPPPLSKFVDGVPARLEEIVEKALAKDPDERYQTAKDFLIDLRNLKRRLEVDAEIDRTVPPEQKGATSGSKYSPLQSQPATASLPAANTSAVEQARHTSSAEYLVGEVKRHKTGALIALLTLILAIATSSYFFYQGGKAAIGSIAVLPFSNVSNDASTEYLSDGVTESIISSLSQLQQLRVMARSTVFRYKGKEAEPQAVGRELNVSAVLIGRVLQQGDNLVIRTELVNVSDGTQLWGAEYSRKLSDVIAVQQDISREISEKLRLRLTGAEQTKLAKRYTENAEAYQLYLKGRFYWNKRRPEDLKKGVKYFQQAIDIDPNYALAYAGLADSYNVFSSYAMLPSSEAFPQAKAAAQKALEIDDTLAEAHTALADVLATYEWNWTAAEREFKRAIELNPNNAAAHYFYGFDYLTPMGRLDEAVTEMKRAQELDPLSLIINTNLGVTLTTARRYDEAVAQFRKTLEIDADFGLARARLPDAYIYNGRYEEGIAEAKRALEHAEISSGLQPYSIVSLIIAYARLGNKFESMRLLKVMEDRPPNIYYSPTIVAFGYAALDDREQAFAWLERGYKERDWTLPRIKVEPAVDSLRSDPRFADLMRRVGLPQ